MHKLRKMLLAVGRLAIMVLLCVTVAVTLMSFSLRAVFEREVYIGAALSDSFVSALYTEVQEYLESECMFYDLPYDTIKTAFSPETVKAVAMERVTVVYDSLLTGEKLPSMAVDPAPFKAAIDSFFETLPFEERPLDSDASQTIAGELAQSTGLVMGLGISDKLVSIAHPFFADTSPLRRLADLGIALLFAIMMLTAVSLIPLRSTLRQRAYTTVGTLFIGSALVAVPMWLFVGHDLPSKLAIGDSALREFVRTALYTVINRANGIATIAFVVSTLLLIASVVWLVIFKKENKVAS